MHGPSHFNADIYLFCIEMNAKKAGKLGGNTTLECSSVLLFFLTYCGG